MPLQPGALDYIGLGQLRQLEPNLTGEDVQIHLVCRSLTYVQGLPQNDYRPDAEHNCLRHIAFDFRDYANRLRPASGHSTAVASVLFGYDPNAFHSETGPFHYEGVLPEASVTCSEFWHFIVDSVYIADRPQADVITMSFGSQFEDWWTRGINALGQHYGTVIVAGIGNGLDAYDPPLYPAAGANVIGVGVIDPVNSAELTDRLASFALAQPDHSSYGPTGDGRAKPDIVAPGNCLAALAGSEAEYEPTGSFSSFSAPLVAGTAGLLIQKARQDPNLAPALSPASNRLLKGVLLNSARKLPFWQKGLPGAEDDHLVPLDYLQGAGALDAAAAYRQLVAGRAQPGDVPPAGWDNNRLEASARNQQKVYRLRLAGGSQKTLTATLLWNKHYAKRYPFRTLPHKDADLRLELWAVDAQTGVADYLLDYSDSPVDNLEHIYAATDPDYTDYELVVTFSRPDEIDDTQAGQPYSVVWNVTEPDEEESILWYDLNADGVVNGRDFAVLVENFTDDDEPGQNIPKIGDLNGDGTIDIADLELLASHPPVQADR